MNLIIIKSNSIDFLGHIMDILHAIMEGLQSFIGGTIIYSIFTWFKHH